MNVVMTFSTRLSAKMIDQLLEAHCRKGRNVRFNGLDITNDGTQKMVTIEFEDPSDRDRFRDAYNGLNRGETVASQATSAPKQRTQKKPQKTGYIQSLMAALFGEGRRPQRRPSR